MIRCPFGNNQRCGNNWNQCRMDCNCGNNSTGNHNCAYCDGFCATDISADSPDQTIISPVLAILSELLSDAHNTVTDETHTTEDDAIVEEDSIAKENVIVNEKKTLKEMQNIQEKIKESDVAEGEPVCGKEQHVFMKCRSFGGTILPEETRGGSTYRLAAVEVQCRNSGRFCVELSFACNLFLTNATVKLGFQTTKTIGNQEVPVGSKAYFFKKGGKTQSDSLMFSVQDYDRFCSGSRVYCVYAEIIGTTSAANMIIENPILAATLVEIPEDSRICFS